MSHIRAKQRGRSMRYQSLPFQLLVFTMISPLALWVQATAVQAQEGWRLAWEQNNPGANVKTIQHSDGDSVIISVYAADGGASVDPKEGLAQIARVMPDCGIGPVTALPKSNSHLMVTGGNLQCVFMYSHANGKTGLVMGRVVGQDLADVLKVADGALQIAMNEPLTGKASASAADAPANVAQPTAPVATGRTATGRAATPATATSLKTSVDGIPAAHRPIGMASVEGEFDSYNATITFDNYLLFPGGYAINSTCKNWNPMQSPAQQKGCSVVRYTQAGAGQVRIGGETSPTNLFEPFATGERVSYDYGNVSGRGGSGYSQTSGSGLQLTRAGQITLSDWSGTSLGGGNYSGYAGNQGGISGSYYLDGYIIAIEDNQGNVSAGFIAKKNEGRDHYLYLNGELFWE
jgi:hypothetical protein